MGQSVAGFAYGLRHGPRTYYFHKLIRYMDRNEYRRAKQTRERVNPQISLAELLFFYVGEYGARVRKQWWKQVRFAEQAQRSWRMCFSSLGLVNCTPLISFL